MKKIRIDKLLLEKNIVSSREKAQELINSKFVMIDQKLILKSSTIVNDDCNIKIIKKNDFVSRAGYKLEKALNKFNVNVTNLICLDIGSSTGGFTDCLLQNNAKLVYAVDVGTNQLAWSLRQNDKVISMEKTNFRYCKKQDFSKEIEFACCDVSFISIGKIVPALSDILLNGKYAIFLIKPQFEADKSQVKKGKINSKTQHIEIIKNIITNVFIKNYFNPIQIDFSPILGNKKGNIEYIILTKKENENENFNFLSDEIESIVESAWHSLVNIK